MRFTYRCLFNSLTDINKAATTLDFTSLPVNTYAGLAAVGDPYNALALVAGNGQLHVWHLRSGKHQTLVQVFIGPCATLSLRLEVWGGQRYRFAYSTDGDDYPRLHDNFPSRIVDIQVGDLVLFPSSLFHRTVPFHADQERVCVAFDVKPALGFKN